MSDDLELQSLQGLQDRITEQQQILQNHHEKQALQQAQLEALRNVLGNYGDYRYVGLGNLLNPNNKNWTDYTYIRPDENEERQLHINAASPIGIFIQQLRDAKTIDDVKKQQELWNFYKPLNSYGNGRDYVRYATTGGYQGSNAPYGGSRPLFPTANESDPVQTTTGGAQDVKTGNGTQDVQAGAQGTQGTQGAQAAKGGIQGTNGSGGTQGTNNNGTYTLGEVAKGGTKTIGYDPYDPNPGNVSLAYAMRNAPEQERRAALIDEWNREHGISYATGKDGLIYRTDPQHPNGYVDPFKNDLSKTGSTYASPGISTGGTYATGQGIKDANGNVLTNPGGDWEYQYALKNPQYGLGMMGKMSDAQREYLQAVSDDMGYKYNFKGAARFV